MKPDGFSFGFVGSLIIQETNDLDGKNCFELVQKIQNNLVGSDEQIIEATSNLESKIGSRGEAAIDKRFYFRTSLENLKMIDMSEVPSPGTHPLISKVEWSSSVEMCDEVDCKEINKVFNFKE